jgi:S-formylglutathione hydrolase FrmB
MLAAGLVHIRPPTRLPVVMMMIGAKFGHPAHWLHAGLTQETIDKFAASQGGNAPVLVFVDSSGKFSNDTECVLAGGGTAADHLTKDVVHYMISKFGVSQDPAKWGVVGWSSGDVRVDPRRDASREVPRIR